MRLHFASAPLPPRFRSASLRSAPPLAGHLDFTYLCPCLSMVGMPCHLFHCYNMSKRSLFWGNASGKLGEAVFYRAGGNQRTRTYVEKIANPRTLPQMINRLGMGNLAAFYRSLAPVLKYSMTERKPGQSAFNVFVQKSKRLDGAVLPAESARAGFSIPYGMCTSVGSAPWAPRPFVIKSADADPVTALAINMTASGEETVNPIISPAYNADALRNGLITMVNARKAWFDGLPVAFKLWVIISEYNDEGFSSYYRSVSIDAMGVQDFTDPTEVQKITVSGDFSNTPAYVVPFGFATATDGTQYLAVGIGGHAGAGNGCYFASAFVSYKDTQLRVSNSTMVAVDGADSDYIGQCLPGGDVYNQVLREYGFSPANPLESVAADVAGGGGILPRPSYQITVTANPANGGSVNGSGSYEEGDTATLQATAAADYEFQRWSDGVTDNPRTIVVSQSLTLQAIFASTDDDPGLAG